MNIKNMFVTVRDNYVIHQVEKIKLPPFSEEGIARYSIVFSGRVQHVGFRLEVCELAKKLRLTGWCENLENGDVRAEIQGADSRIQYLIAFMESLKRIKIKHKTIEKLPINEGETSFVKRG